MPRKPFAPTLLIGLVLAATASGQGFLDELEKELADGASRVEAERDEPTRRVPPSGDKETASKAPGYLGLIADETSGRVRVQLVRPGGPAEGAGILVGDVIQAVNGRPVGSLDAMAELLSPHAAGDRISMYVRRDRALLLTNVTLGKRPTVPLARPVEKAAGADTTPPAAPPVDALSALEKLDRLLEADPPVAPPPPAATKIPPARIKTLESELEAVRRRIAELERELADLKK